MQPALDSTTLDRLIALGRQRGHLTTEDLQASLPIAGMSAEEIALIVVHLEEMGVAVEIEEALLAPNAKPVPRPSAEIILFPGPSVKNVPPGKSRPLQTSKPAPPEPSQAKDTSVRPAHWIVAAAGFFALAVFLLVIFATAG